MSIINLDKLKEIMKQKPGRNAKIKIVGVGGGVTRAINLLIASGIKDTDFVTVDSNCNISLYSKARNRIQIGKDITNGLGTRGRPKLGEQAAEAAREILIEQLRGTEIVFIVAGLGGGIGTGAAPILVECAREIGALTVGIVTKPFSFEGKRQTNQAEAGISKLKERVDMLVTITSDRLLQEVDRKTPTTDLFRILDYTLQHSVQAIIGAIAILDLVEIDIKE